MANVHKLNINKKFDPPERFLPSELPKSFFEACYELGKEIFFRPMAHFVRLENIANKSRAKDRIYFLIQVLVTLLSVCVAWGIVLWIIKEFCVWFFLDFYSLTLGETILVAWLPAIVMFLITAGASFFWYWIKEGFYGGADKGKNLYIFLNRILLRGFIFGSAGFLWGAIHKLEQESKVLSSLWNLDVLLAAVLGMILGVGFRQTLAITRFGPLFRDDRQYQYYNEKTQHIPFSGVSIIQGVGAIVWSLWLRGPESFGMVSKYMYLFGYVALFAGPTTSWGLVFWLSWIRHGGLVSRWKKGEMTAEEVLAKSPVGYDEIQLFPLWQLESLLSDIPQKKYLKRIPSWWAFVLTQTYKRDTAAKVIAKHLDDGILPLRVLLKHFRENSAYVGSLETISKEMKPGIFQAWVSSLLDLDTETLKKLAKDLSDQDLSSHSWARDLKALATAASTSSVIQWVNIKGAGASLDLDLFFNKLEKAKTYALRDSRGTYHQRLVALRKAEGLIKEARRLVEQDPWFKLSLEKATDQWLEDLNLRTEMLMGGSELEIILPGLTLQINKVQNVPIQIFNHGPSSATNIKLLLRVEGCDGDWAKMNDLKAQDSHKITVYYTPTQIGDLTGEVEVHYDDDSGKDHIKIYRTLFTVKEVLRVFKPFLNPFTPGTPAREVDIFHGRGEEINFFLSNPKSSLFIKGPRRIGKTSLLYQMKDRCGDRSCILIDCQDLEGHKNRSTLTEALFDVFPNKQESLDHVVKGFLSQPGRPVLMIDECDYFPLINKRLNNQLSTFIRSSLNHFDCQVVLSGHLEFGHDLETSLGEVYQMLTVLPLNVLNRNDTYDLLRIPLKDHMDIQADVLPEFYQLTGGHPHVAQYFSQIITSSAIQSRTTLIDRALLESVIPQAISALEQTFRHYFWGKSGDRHKEILKKLADRENPIGGGEINSDEADSLEDLKKSFLVSEQREPEILIGLFEHWIWKNILRRS